MKKQFKIAACVGFLAGSMVAGQVLAEVSANAAVTSNYVFRGVTMSADHAAVQGGLDWSHESGLYVGTWLSNVDLDKTNKITGTEYDIYAGIANDIGAFGYDVGYFTYNYSNKEFANNGNEIKFGVKYGPAKLNYYIGDSGAATMNKYNYVELNLGYELAYDFGIDAHYGVTSGDYAKSIWNNASKPEKNSLSDYSAAVSKSFAGYKFSVNHAKAESEDKAKNFVMLSKVFNF